MQGSPPPKKRPAMPKLRGKHGGNHRPVPFVEVYYMFSPSKNDENVTSRLNVAYPPTTKKQCSIFLGMTITCDVIKVYII